MNEHANHNHSTNGNRPRPVDQASAYTAPMQLAPVSSTVRYIINVLFRYRYRMTLFFIVAFGAVIVGLIVWPREYSSEAKMLVRVGRSSVALDPTVTTARVMEIQMSREVEMNSLLEVLGSRSILEHIVDTVDPKAPYPTPMARERAIKKMRKRLKIYSPEKSSVISITYAAASPELAQKIVQEVVDLFLAEHLRATSNSQSYEFFEREALSTKATLDKAVQNVRDAKNDFKIASVAGRRLILEKTLGDVEKLIIDNDAALQASQARLAVLQGKASHLSDVVVKRFAESLPTAAASNRRQQIYNLEKSKQLLLSKFGENHPEVVSVNRQIYDLIGALAAEQPDRAQATSADLLKEIVNESAHLARQKSLQRQYDRLQDELKELNTQEVLIVDLERQVRLADTKYHRYEDNLEQARISQELQKDAITDINVIQPASLVVKASSPKKVLTLVLGGLTALIGALALAFLSDVMNQSLRSAVEVEQQLSVPVLTSIPHVRGGVLSKQR